MESWAAAFSMVPTDGGIYEYACPEGNRGMVNILSFARLEEQAQEAAPK